MKKRILLITNGYPFGESERSFLNTEIQQLSRQFHIDVLAPEDCGELLYPTQELQRIGHYSNKPMRASGIGNLLSCVVNGDVAKEFWLRAKSHGFRALFGDFKATVQTYHYAWVIAKQITDMMEEKSVDVIYTYWCLPYTLGALLAKRKYPHLKVVTRFHGYDLYNERTACNWQPFRHVISKECDRLIFACDAGRDYYLSHWGQKWAEKSVVSYLGCAPLTRIPMQETERLTLVSCSYAIPLKRIHLIIEALALLPAQIPVDWHHIGDGQELEALKQLASHRLTPKTNIQWKFWGYVPNHQLDELYQQLQPQLFITTSSTEGVPVSIQEAFSAGFPAIGTPVGGIPELIQTGKTGYLLSETPEPAEVAEKITAFCDLTPRQRQTMGENAHALWREKLDAKKNAIRFTKMLVEITA